jgi:competence protein ComEC
MPFTFDSRIAARFSMLLAIAFALLVLPFDARTAAAAARADTVELHFLDVGQGDGALFLTPNRTAIVIDAGRRAVGSSVVTYLREHGVTRVHAIAPSHAHADHVGGFISILTSFPVDEAWLTRQTDKTVTWRDFSRLLNRGRIPKRNLADGQTWDVDGVRVEVFNPPRRPFTGSAARYENSHVLRLTYGSVAFLFTGDIHRKGIEGVLMRHPGGIKAQVLKVSEHGGGTGTTEQFVRAVDPRFGLVGVGRGNSYRHPATAVLNTLNQVGAVPLRTDECGTVIVTTDGTDLTVHPQKACSNLAISSHQGG